MKLWKIGGVYHFRDTIACPPSECDKCRLGLPHTKHSKRIQKSLGTGTKAEADALVEEFLRVAKLRSIGKEPVPTLSETVRDWLIANDEKSDSHKKAVRDFGKLHLYGLGDLAMDKLSTSVVESAMREHHTGRSLASVAHWLRILNALGNWLVRRDVLDAIPWRVPMPRLQKRPRPILREEQALAWISSIDKAAYRKIGDSNLHAVSVAVRLMIGLGLRESEVIGARWELFRKADNGWVYIPGRGDGKQFKSKGKQAKPKAVPSWLISYLQPIWADMGLVLVDTSGHAFSQGFWRKAFASANKDCGTDGITPHRLRGTFATWLSKSRPIQEVQAALGHADVRTTMGYLEIDLGETRSALDEIGKRAGLA